MHLLAEITTDAEIEVLLTMYEEERETVEIQVYLPESDDRSDENRTEELNSKSVPATPTIVICPLDDITPDGPVHVLATPTAVSMAGCRTVWHVMLSCWVVKSRAVLGRGMTLTVGDGTRKEC